MAKYINLELVNTLLDNISVAGTDGILTFSDGVEFVKDIINDMLPNGTIEIVRCKDCKYCKKAEEKYEGGRFEPTDIVCNVFDIYTHPNEFCSYGKRRETDE